MSIPILNDDDPQVKARERRRAKRLLTLGVFEILIWVSLFTSGIYSIKDAGPGVDLGLSIAFAAISYAGYWLSLTDFFRRTLPRWRKVR